MKKKFGAVILAGAMVCTVAAGFAGCSLGGGRASDFEYPEEGFDTTKKVTITFYHSMGAGLQTILNDYIKMFNKIYPNITIEHKTQGDWDGVRDVITTELQGGNHPNIAYCYADHVADYNVAGAVQTLDDFLADGALKDKTVPTILVDENGDYVDENGDPAEEPVTVDRPLGLTQEEQALYNPLYFNEGYSFGDDKMYTLPWAKSTEMIFYNKDFFDEHGLTPPATWDEMEELCKKIKAIDTTNGHVPFGYDSEDNWFITMCEQSGSEYTSAESPHFRFVNDTNKAFVQKFKDWYKKGYFTTSALASTGTNSVYTSNLLLEKSIYMSIGSSGGATYNLDMSSGKAKFQVGIAPVPQLHPEDPKMISQGPSVCIFKDNDPQKVLASWLFVKFMTTNPYYQTEVAMNNGYMPVLKSSVMDGISTYKDWIDHADGGVYLTAQAVKVGMEHEQHYFVSPAFSGSSAARDEVGKIMPQAFQGTREIEKAFNDALAALTPFYGA